MPSGYCKESLNEVLQVMFATAPEKAGGLLAAFLMAWPAIHSELKDLSDGATLMLPILGAGFFILRYWATILEIREFHRKKLEDANKDNDI